MPVQPLEIRPAALTPVASAITKATPPTARVAKCVACHSLAWLNLARRKKMDKLKQIFQSAPTIEKKLNKRLSGLQIQVLSLYKKLLRAAEKKDPSQMQQFKQYIHQEFKVNKDSIKSDQHQRIEFFIRQGHAKLQMLESQAMKKMSVIDVSARNKL